YYVYVLTDRHNTVYEHTDEGNNTGKSGGLTLSAYPPVDLAVTSLNTDAAGSSGNAFAIGYTVTNTGGGTTLANSWLDIVYLSPDSVLDYGYDMVLNRVDRVLPLAAGAAYTRTMSPVIPNGISGDYYVIVQADSAGKVIDADPANNRRHTTTPVTITLTPSPDLSVSGVTAPSGGQAGQPLTVTWIVGNNGADMSAGRAWLDGLYLSADATVDNEDARLGSVERNGPLLNGATYIDTLEIVLPNYASGVYYLLARADSRNDIYEHNAEANNTGSRLITVTLPPPADLVVSSVVIPPAGTVGEDVTIGWTIENQGVNSATGRMTDAVYFSADNAWDLSDLLLGTILRDIDIAPGASEKKSLKANLSAAWLADSTGSVMEETPGLSPGDYYVIVRTDIRNNIRETDVTNNQGASGSTMNVDVQSLTLGVTDSGTISSASPRYYRVDVPANLDLRVTAVSSIAYPSIDLFSAYDRVPTGNSYDHRNFDPVSLNREVLVPSTQVGSYYLLMRSIINPHPLVTESYTVLAETLGFSVTSVIPGNGGSGGFVTGRMQGAGFRATSRIFLYDGAQQVAEAELREFKSTMETNIRWDLRGVPLGTYDVEVRNEDNSTARLPAGFTVEPMQDPAISIGKTLPRALLPGRRQTYHIRFTNTSNVDIQYFTAMIAVPEGTEISVVSENDLLRTRSMMVPDSLIPEGKSVDDWVESGSGRFVPLIGRDLPPGDAYVCRVTFRNTAYPAGSSFPMLVTTKTATKELFLEIQVAQIEKYRADILRQSAGVDPEYVARANDPVAFTRYALSSYVSMGLLDSADVPGVGMEAIAAATGQWGLANPVFAAAITPRFPGLFSPNTNKDCEQFFNIVACPAAIIDCFIDLPFIPPPISVGLCVFGIATSCLGFDFGPLNYIGCIGIASGLTCLGKEFLCRDIVASLDPNDIIGPDGAGDERWVARQQTLPYTIRFQNDSVKATAPARRVTITQDLDSTVDVRSLRLGSYGFGAQVYSVPENVSTYNDRLDLRDSMGIFVDVTAGIDIVNGRLAWTFNSVDPLTGGEPPDPFTGFLPVDDSTGRGSGFVSYTVRPSPESKTRDTVHAIASIVFDINDPLDTPPIFNLVDAASPVSSVRPLPPTIDITSFPVQWGGIDDSAGSGSKHYTIYYSRNGEPYTPWLTNVTDTIAVFTGIDTSQYSFFSIATDTAGNTEAFKSTPDATTTILTGVEDQVEELPKTFALLQNYPNPFNPTTLIRYDVPSAAWVRLAVYNVLGQEVTVLINGPEDPGHRVVEWNALNRHGLALGSGVYFYRMQSGAFSDMKKMMLVK
ncbi:MAG TPA: CARDB domain-containing protein, partial [Bacteroidota bacterium]|nr:CARDB domain-containing protein [Bacteroidota bacterium]